MLTLMMASFTIMGGAIVNGVIVNLRVNDVGE